MLNTPSPSYLRLHRGDAPGQSTASARSAAERFWETFQVATGWRIDREHPQREVSLLPAAAASSAENAPSDSSRMTDAAGPAGASGESASRPFRDFPSGTQDSEPASRAGSRPESPPSQSMIRENARALAESAAAMAHDIENLQAVVRRQEIELASHAASQLASAEAGVMASAVTETLEAAVAATSFDAAVIYMLDDDTEHLIARAAVGVPESDLLGKKRPLRGSRADLEALVQEVVLMDDLLGIAGDTWNAPESFGAAICASICRGDLPIGTVWLFSRSPRELGASDRASAQLCSRQLSLVLSAASQNRREERIKEFNSAITDLSNWQYSALPADNLLAPGWRVDGMLESPVPWSSAWHAWDVLPDGSLMLAVAEAEEKGAAGAMIAATARAALAAHCGYRHRPEQMLQRISDTLWHTNTAEQLVSLLYARIDPESGEGTVVSSGTMEGLIAGKYGYRPLIKTGARPLASGFEVDFFESSFHLLEGETLLAYGEGLTQDGIGQELIGCTLRSTLQSGRFSLAALRREFAAFPLRNERSVVSLSRRSP